MDHATPSAAGRVTAKSDLCQLMREAEAMTRTGWERELSYSRKVFIPLTQLCRDVCHYCTFAQVPKRLSAPYLSLDACLAIARRGQMAGCKEALFTLGDKPELRHPIARSWLDEHGYASTLDYLHAAARLVLEETGLLPHLNPGVMTAEDLVTLRPVAVSMGLMIETAADRLSERGGPHFGSPDKVPERRLETLRLAGEASVPMTTGLLIGIGETRQERLDALYDLRDIHKAHGHIQEVIIQNFRAKPGTRMSGAPEPSLEEHLWTIAAARLILGPEMSLQAPPNLQPEALQQLVRAGINDWGGVSPVTPDHVNPEAPWPHLEALGTATRAAGRHLVERLAIGPGYVREASRWLDKDLVRPVLRAADATGLARCESWHAGTGAPAPQLASPRAMPTSPEIERILERAEAGCDLAEAEIVRLFAARDADLDAVLAAADRLRQQRVGDTITFVANRNINYTNICLYRCTFCAFSKGGGARDARGPAYKLDFDEIGRRAEEAWQIGASEVCLQGGIHPDYTGDTYLRILDAVKSAAPDIHIHAFSPLEIVHGASTLGQTLETYLRKLKRAGLSTLPGTAAEILDDDVRRVICPDKVNTAAWLEVMATAHAIGLRSTATIMFGHVDHPRHWARHLLRIRALQTRSGGFTEFVPLPFVHMEAPMWRKGEARSGPTYREALLMHAVARLVLDPHIINIQTSWAKMGPQGAAACLQTGANDLGGTLINESITRAAGGVNGQLMDESAMRALASSIGRPLRRRTTVYAAVAGTLPAREPALPSP